MKPRSRAPKNYPNWRQHEGRMLLWAIAVGGVAASIVGLLVWLLSRDNGY